MLAIAAVRPAMRSPGLFGRCAVCPAASAAAPFACSGDIFFARRITEPYRRFGGDFFDVLHEFQVVRAHKRNGVTLMTGAASAADAVHVVVRRPREIKVEDV